MPSALLSSLRLFGDVVLMLPLVDMIRARHPGCAIDMLVPAGMRGLLAHDPRLRRVLEHRKGSRGYVLQTLMRTHWAFAQNCSDRSVLSVALAGRRRRFAARTHPPRPKEAWKHLVLTDLVPVRPGTPVIKWCVSLAQAAGLDPQRCRATLYAGDEDDAAVERLLLPHGAGRECFVIHAASRYPYKEWPMERWVAVSDAIAARHRLTPVWTGAPTDAGRLNALAGSARVQPVVAAGSLGLPAVTALLERARLFLGVDTAVTHMAAASDIPMVALFGPTPTRGWAPWNNFAPIDYDFPSAGGSFRNGHISTVQDRASFERDIAAEPLDMQQPTASMSAITIAEVLAEAEHALALPDPRTGTSIAARERSRT